MKNLSVLLFVILSISVIIGLTYLESNEEKKNAEILSDMESKGYLNVFVSRNNIGYVIIGGGIHDEFIKKQDLELFEQGFIGDVIKIFRIDGSYKIIKTSDITEISLLGKNN